MKRDLEPHPILDLFPIKKQIPKIPDEEDGARQKNQFMDKRFESTPEGQEFERCRKKSRFLGVNGS